MPAGTPHDRLEYPAPIGMRVRVVTLLVFVVLAGLTAFHALGLPATPGTTTPPWVGLIGPGVGLMIVVPILCSARVRGYRLAGTDLHVVRHGRVNRYPLAGLVGVEVDRAVMRDACKIWGNDGLGAVTGRFRHKRLGRFTALLTDSDSAVVLRWPGHCLVISPARPHDFVEHCRGLAFSATVPAGEAREAARGMTLGS
jgi:hypothetical protein